MTADARGLRVALGAFAFEIVGLLVTGVALFFLYRPTGAQPWLGSDAPSEAVVSLLRGTHRALSTLAVLTALAAAVLTIATATATARRALAIVGGVSLLVTTCAATFTGSLLPWDQLALSAVPAGENLTGYRPFLGDDVRFVLMDGFEVESGTFRAWLVLHALVSTPLASILAVVLWRRARASAIDAGSPPARAAT